MSESEESGIPCPRCWTPMIIGQLSDPVNVIHVESRCSLEGSSLEAWICPACAHVELLATHPEDPARHDISYEELGVDRDEWEGWAQNL